MRPATKAMKIPLLSTYLANGIQYCPKGPRESIKKYTSPHTKLCSFGRRERLDHRAGAACTCANRNRRKHQSTDLRKCYVAETSTEMLHSRNIDPNL
ncbi:hypothetical protein Zmor_007577 [Zophobas morio]|uniref:Uncharacterized protein n=1 Tax=Zophobas morio TaxID=2755281 RepID=A0AA38IYF9_9CUCU|nr:hypothetical protein Zmor_007577 [Zophobas morio]